MVNASSRGVDPITAEVIRNYYISSGNQMRSILLRASFNPIIYEMIDFSVGLYNKKAELLAEGQAFPFFCGTLTFGIRSVVEYLGENRLEDGDVILSTYGYWTGGHSQDILIFKPIFIEGELFGYAAVKAHWTDIGASDVYGVNTTDCWQEGLQLYGVKIVKQGTLDRELVEILRANSRTPDTVIGDMRGQIAACEYGARKVVELVRKYGKETVEAATEKFLDHGEQIARKALAELPDGEWSAEGFMDDNGITDDPVPVRLTVRKRGDEIVFDTTGSAPTQRGPVNSPWSATLSGCRLVFKMLTSPMYPANEGFFRPVKLIAPEGSVFNAQKPAPMYLYGWSLMPLGEVAFKALAEVMPEKVVANCGGDLYACVFSGLHPEDGSFFVSATDEACGMGASHDRDGENALIAYWFGECRNVPIEVIEQRYPFLVEKYALRQDSGGAGKFRGGLGVEKVTRSLANVSLCAEVERTKDAPFGLFGGRPGKANTGVLQPGTPGEKRIGKVVGYPLPKGETWHLSTGGGGGWGDPHQRSYASVLSDVVQGYVSLENARRDYGVVINLVNDQYLVDEAETARLREPKQQRC